MRLRWISAPKHTGASSWAQILANQMKIASLQDLVNSGTLVRLWIVPMKKDAPTIEFLCRSAYPNTDHNQVINKMQPDCLKLASVVQKCKF